MVQVQSITDILMFLLLHKKTHSELLTLVVSKEISRSETTLLKKFRIISKFRSPMLLLESMINIMSSTAQTERKLKDEQLFQH